MKTRQAVAKNVVEVLCDLICVIESDVLERIVERQRAHKLNHTHRTLIETFLLAITAKDAVLAADIVIHALADQIARVVLGSTEEIVEAARNSAARTIRLRELSANG